MREVRHGEDHVWARSSVVEEEAVDHERVIGVVRVTGDEVVVRVAQRVDHDLLADPVVITMSRPRITVGETFETDAAQAREIAECLWRAADFMDALGSPERRPRLVTRG
ncbi:hypothetical protein KIH74_13765 [Kineosporia sp. J2-2]|uniref:Uncharacterized protein n=1 Tax=Kineosporia corallincola TaxID=2835133 RepID=A0ABS5TFY4_9ACTN|nr:hypothetical protein [Kineosporia corallincola]MBT0770000.1 hypothetical protein [Kineosporia corallincola]